MFIPDVEDQKVISKIESKPYRLYLLPELLPKTRQISGNQAMLLESRLNRLNEARIIYKVAIKDKIYYFSPKAETEENN
jgi:hypothetical protein